MSVVENLKKISLQLRKERSPIAASITFALSEIEKIGKNNGNRETTDDEAIKVVQKLVATIDSNLLLDLDDGRKIALNHEKNILNSVLPEMVSDEEVQNYLRDSFVEKPANKGVVMKVLRAKYGSLIDMKRAGELVSEIYGL